MLFFSCSQILCGYIDNTIGVNIEGNFNLRNTSSCRRNSVQTELSKSLIVPCKLSLTLYYMDTVSYTHLDVYKRQGLNRASVNNAFGIR